MRLFIGLSGRIGSGKTVISKHLQKRYGAREHRFSEILEGVLDRLHLPHNRENLQKLGKSLREELGQDVIVNAMKTDLQEETARIVVIDGIRYKNEVEMLRSLKENVLIFVSAPAELRYERSVKRGIRGEAAMSFEEFMEKEKAATERWIDELAGEADYVLDNTGTLKELIKQVDGLMKQRRAG